MAACTVKFQGIVDKFGHRYAYAFRCVQCEYSMRYSEKFLEGCYSICRDNGNRFWQSYFEKHLEEERGHHAWAASDLKKVQELVGCVPQVSDEIKELLAYQEKQISEGNFFPQIGYCISVEGYQGSARNWKSFAASAKIPTSAFKNAIRHSVIDREHISELWSLFELCSNEEKAVISESARFTAIQQFRSMVSFLQKNAHDHTAISAST